MEKNEIKDREFCKCEKPIPKSKLSENGYSIYCEACLKEYSVSGFNN